MEEKTVGMCLHCSGGPLAQHILAVPPGGMHKQEREPQILCYAVSSITQAPLIFLYY